MHQNNRRPWLPWAVAIALLAAIIVAMGHMRDVLTPFVTAAVLAYILNPLVERLQRRGIRRGMASMSVMLIALGVILLMVLIAVPMVLNQVNNMVARLPALVAFSQKTVLPWLAGHVDLKSLADEQQIALWLHDNLGSIQAALSKAIPALIQQGSNVMAIMGNLFLLPFLLYYFLLDWARWNDGIKLMVPRRYIDSYTRITRNMDSVLGQFMRGQLTVMLIMGVLYGAGLAVVGLDSGFAIGMLAGLLVFVPYLGAFTGLLLATLAAVLQFGHWQGVLSVWAVFAVGQFLESFFITPKIVGDSIGLSPFWVIFALMAFGNLFGFVGMLLALPLAAITLVLLREAAEQYLNSRFYLQQNR